MFSIDLKHGRIHIEHACPKEARHHTQGDACCCNRAVLDNGVSAACLNHRGSCAKKGFDRLSNPLS